MKLPSSLRLLFALLLTVGLAVAGGFTAPTDAQQLTFDCSGYEDCSSLIELYCSAPVDTTFVFGACDDGNGDIGGFSCFRTGFVCRLN